MKKRVNCKLTFLKIISLSVLLVFFSGITSCKKLVEIQPQQGTIAGDNVFTDDATAIAAVSGIYYQMSIATGAFGFTGTRSISLLAGLGSDELDLFSIATSDVLIGYYTNALSVIAPAPVSGSDAWTPMYNLVYRCNSAIEGLSNSTADALRPAIRKQLMGEAKFLRAFFYFYLVNMFGDLPLVTGTDYTINAKLARNPVSDVYRLIIKDLKEAKNLLSSNYLDATLLAGTSDRVRPNRWAATALLARAYLYNGNNAEAEAEATELINNNTIFDLPSLNNAFLRSSKEAIWQLQPTRTFFNAGDAPVFVTLPTGPHSSRPVYVSSRLITAFENGDKRAVYGNWLDTTIYLVNGTNFDTAVYPFKYKEYLSNPNITIATGTQNMTEFLMVFRLAEQYLIRSEARAKQTNIAGAITDLDKIRGRAGLPLLATTNPGISQNALLDAILHERQVELFSEWGHRWFDLKRTGKIDAVMTVVTPQKSQGINTWQSYQQLYPLPQADLDKSIFLKQNPGY
ncbi:MAG: RagB/SusD family nutrient uptake outer membrane protein [Sediminibacterium sp.]